MIDNPLHQKINHETAIIRWRELQRFFASGKAIAVDSSLDLMQVASTLADDNAAQLKIWMESGLVDVVKDQQAHLWFAEDASLWAVVIKPWVLVQPERKIS